LTLVASAERYSEHPLAEAARARERHLDEPEDFEALPGLGVRTRVNGGVVAVGNRRMIPEASSLSMADELEAQGKTLTCNWSRLAASGPPPCSPPSRGDIKRLPLIEGGWEGVTTVLRNFKLFPLDRVRTS
jgi:hypothetical protein